MEQRCYLWNVWLSWIGLALLAVVVWWRAGLAVALVITACGAAAQLLYIRWFPALSALLGYGSVVDAPPVGTPVGAPAGLVTLYTANLCPFCPIIRRRLAGLQQQMRFELQEIDVTFRPDLIRAKRLRSVPAVEAGDRMLTGNATSRQLALFLSGSGGSTSE